MESGFLVGLEVSNNELIASILGIDQDRYLMERAAAREQVLALKAAARGIKKNYVFRYRLGW